MILVGLWDSETKQNFTNYSLNKIGGTPDWMVNDNLDQSYKCEICGRSQILVAQVYCPLQDSVFHRTLYIFACTAANCSRQSKGWRVIRSQLLDKSYKFPEVIKPEAKEASDSWGISGADDWGVADADDWGDDGGDQKEASSNYTAESATKHTTESATKHTTESATKHTAESATKHTTESATKDSQSVTSSDVDSKDSESAESSSVSDFGTEVDPDIELADYTTTFTQSITVPGMEEALQNLTMDSTEAIETAPTQTTEPLKSFYISVVESEDSPSKDSEAMGQRGTGRVSTGKNAKGQDDAYEKSNLKHGDRVFQKFTKAIADYPQQILRYNYRGKPLLLNSAGVSTIPHCTHCGSERVFELQLMPALVSYIHQCNDSALDFGCVFVYTCAESCWSEAKSRLEECCQVQLEQDQYLLNKIKE